MDVHTDNLNIKIGNLNLFLKHISKMIDTLLKEDLREGITLLRSTTTFVDNLESLARSFSKINVEPKLQFKREPIPQIYVLPKNLSYVFYEGFSPWDFTLKVADRSIFRFLRNELLRYFEEQKLQKTVPPLEIGKLYISFERNTPFRGILLEETKHHRFFYCIDTDITICISRDTTLYEIPATFHTFPAQTIRCSLTKEKWLEIKWEGGNNADFKNFMHKSIFTLDVKEQLSLQSPPTYFVGLKAHLRATNSVINVTEMFNSLILPAVQQGSVFDFFNDESFTEYLIEDNKCDTFDGESHNAVSHQGSISTFTSSERKVPSSTESPIADEKDSVAVGPDSDSLLNTFTSSESRNLIILDNKSDKFNGEAHNAVSHQGSVNTFTSSDYTENRLVTSPIMPPKPILPAVGTEIEIIPTYVVSGLKFYAQIKGTDSEFLTKNMEEKFQNCLLQEYLGESVPSENELILVLGSDKKWHRGIVVSLIGIVVTVRYIDYGNISDVELSRVRKLGREFQNVPPQAVYCELQHDEAGCKDSLVIAKKKLKSLLGKTIYALVKKRDEYLIWLTFINN